jgi:NAD(P)-dependent dehydrogenase (short-subunit alcohol dehydrogenase family)
MKATQLFSLAGTTALVTGAGTGLGRQFALALADAGAVVIVCGRRLAPLQDVAATVRDAGGSAHCLALDITDPASVEAAFGAAEAIGPIDVLVNNAGVGVGKPLNETTLEDWQLVMDTNLKGTWLASRAAVARMIPRGKGGSIINISSILGSAVRKGSGVYAASKAGLSHLTRVMALEWARFGIRANAIEPGYFMTGASAGFLESEAGERMIKRIPVRRLGDLAELDGALLLLASSASSYMTGTTLTVDGGLSLPVI